MPSPLELRALACLRSTARRGIRLAESSRSLSRQEEESMSTMTSVIGAVAGAGLMYAFDPVSGARRRARVRDRMDSARRQVTDGTETILRDAQSRGHGLWTAILTELAPEDGPARRRWAPSARAGGAAFGGGLVLD